jgi:hypothetical protein
MLSKEGQNNYREIFEPYLQGKCPRNLCDFSSHGGQYAQVLKDGEGRYSSETFEGRMG